MCIFYIEWLLLLIYLLSLGQILVGTLYLSLTYVNLIPASLAGLVVSRDLFLVYAGLHSHSFPALEQAGHFYYVCYQCC